MSIRERPSRVWQERRNRPTRIRRAVSLALVVVLGASACNETGNDPITVVNQSQEPLQIWSISPEGELLTMLFELDSASQNILPQEQCTGLAAVRRDGTEAGRIGRICQGDPPWVITEAGG